MKVGTKLPIQHHAERPQSSLINNFYQYEPEFATPEQFAEILKI